MSEKAPRRDLRETPRSLPPNLAAWLSERTPEIGFPHSQGPREMVFQLAMVLDYSAEDKTSVASHWMRALACERLFGRSKRRKIDRNPFKVTWLSIMLVLCQHGLEKINRYKRNGRNVANDSDSRLGKGNKRPDVHCDRRGRHVGTQHEFHFADRNREP